jgi:hypothetical protein
VRIVLVVALGLVAGYAAHAWFEPENPSGATQTATVGLVDRRGSRPHDAVASKERGRPAPVRRRLAPDAARASSDRAPTTMTQILPPEDRVAHPDAAFTTMGAISRLQGQLRLRLVSEQDGVTLADCYARAGLSPGPDLELDLEVRTSADRIAVLRIRSVEPAGDDSFDACVAALLQGALTLERNLEGEMPYLSREGTVPLDLPLAGLASPIEAVDAR